MKISARTANRLRRNIAGYTFMLPLIIGISVFSFWPIISSLIYSFHKYDGFMTYEFVGLRNYEDLFKNDIDGLGKVFANTFIFAGVSVVLNLSLSYLLALSVSMQGRGVYAVRVLFYIPCVIPGVVMAAMWTDLLAENGAFNSILTSVGLPKYTFLDAPETSMITLFITSLWGLGGGMILWLAAFNNIPRTMYEAAEIDGAKSFTKFVKITIPMTTPTIFYNLITGVIGSLQYNGTLMLAPNSGRGYNDSVFFISVKIYRDAFKRMKFGYASAAAWILFAIIGVLVIIMFKTSKWVFYGDE